MQTLRYLATLLPLLLVVACDRPSTTVVATDDAALHVSANAIYDEVDQLSPAEKTQLYSDLGAMTWTQVYQFVTANATDAKIVVDGASFSGALTGLKRQPEALLNLSKVWPTVGAMWRALNIEPAQITRTSFLNSAQKALNPKISLALGSGVSKDTGAGDVPLANLNRPATIADLGPPIMRADCADVMNDYLNIYSATTIALASAIHDARINNKSDRNAILTPDGKNRMVPVAGSSLYAYLSSAGNGHVLLAEGDPTTSWNNIHYVAGSEKNLADCFLYTNNVSNMMVDFPDWGTDAE